MLSGEYVVLDGVVALVAAVDRRLVAIGSPRSDDGSTHRADDSPGRSGLRPEALLARKRAEAALGPTDMTLRVDPTALQNADGTKKLGLGSSSAASASAAAAVVAWHGEDPAERREDIFDWALAGHRAIAPEGSGADVAAATHGGIVRYRIDARPKSVSWPRGLEVAVVWTGTPARTSDLVAAVKSFASASPNGYAETMAGLRAAAISFCDSFVAGDVRASIDAAGEHGRAMSRLGRAANAPIVTDALAHTAALAESCGGASKPSGAGGGDVALAFFDDPDRLAAFREACARDSLMLVDARLGAEGVRQESA